MTKLVQLLEVHLLFIVVAAIAFFTRFILKAAQRTIGAFLSGLLIGMMCAILAGMTAMEAGLPEFMSLAITACTAIFAQDILFFLLNNQKDVMDLFKRASENLIDKYTKK